MLMLTIFRHEPSALEKWNEKIHLGKAKVEVGVFVNEKPMEFGEVLLGGFQAIIGEDRKPSKEPFDTCCNFLVNPPVSDPIRVSFSSRHHQSAKSSGATYKINFPLPTGLHPTLRLSFPSALMRPPFPYCTLHTYLTLPSVIFPDKYQLSSPLLLSSKNIRAIRSLSGATDLEAPNWVVSKWGSAMLVEIAFPISPEHQFADSEPFQNSWHAEIPLHFRYLSPIAGGITNVSISWPIVFWACPTEEGAKMSASPFDRVNMGYEGLFGPRTMFYHLQPQSVTGETLVETVQIPVLNLDRSRTVEAGTMGVVFLGCIWILGKLVKSLWGGRWTLSIQTNKKTE